MIQSNHWFDSVQQQCFECLRQKNCSAYPKCWGNPAYEANALPVSHDCMYIDLYVLKCQSKAETGSTANNVKTGRDLRGHPVQSV